jgi:D-alanine-D-alanine ligase
MTAAAPLTFRDEPRAADLARIREIVDATGFFSAEESNVAIELLDDRLARGPASDYRFLIAELDGRIVGYTAYGRVPLTRSSWDVYWLAVDPAAQGRGIGAALFAETERLIALAGGERIYLETSGRPQYQPTRRFYERRAYVVAATLPDFYAPGDAKVILVKVVAGHHSVALGDQQQ